MAVATQNKSPQSQKNQGDKTQTKTSGSGSGIASVEGILMFSIALVLDGAGFVLLLLSWLGIDDYLVLDILGITVFGLWLIMTRGMKGVKKIMPKFLAISALEIIPFIGSASPSWIYFVFSVFKNE